MTHATFATHRYYMTHATFEAAILTKFAFFFFLRKKKGKFFFAEKLQICGAIVHTVLPSSSVSTKELTY